MNMSLAQNISVEIDALLVSADLSERFYRALGSTRPLDATFMFALTPLNAFSCAFNTFFVVRLCLNGKKLGGVPLYRLLTVCAANNALFSFVQLFAFVSMTPHFVSSFFLLLIYSRLYRCLVFDYGLTTLYFVGKVLEILILLDRLANFHPRIKRHMATLRLANTRLSVPIIYAACAAINVPFLMQREPTSDERLLHDLVAFNETRTIAYCAQDPLMGTIVGTALITLNTFVRDFFILCIELVLSVRLVVSFRRFLSSKVRQTRRADEHAPTTTSSPHFKSFKKTTHLIAKFVTLSVLANLVALVMYALVSSFSSLSHLLVAEAFMVIIVLMIAKSLLTFVVLLKLDKNFVDVFRCFCQVKPS